MGRTDSFGRIVGIWLLSGLCVASLASNSATAQNAQYSAKQSATRSRAEQEAEQRVALSPDKIIDLLREEPGLLLQVKKMLVRKAYEQGRILDPEELSDNALLQLLREDHAICVLATREIEDREYVKAKPSREEIDRQRELDAQIGGSRVAANPAQHRLATRNGGTHFRTTPCAT